MSEQSQLWRSSFRNVIQYRDSEGRPLGEYKSQSHAREGVPMLLKECPYSDSRYKHPSPMNVSALDQIIHHWDSVTGALDFLRSLYIHHTGCGQISMLDLWRIGRMGECLPSFLLFREKEPVSDGALPPFVGALFKVVIGINASIQLQYIEEKMVEGRVDESVVEPASVYQYADERGLLIGPDMVCAGPKNMILELLKVMVHGNGAALSDHDAMRSLISDTNAFFDYSRTLINYQIAEFLSDTLSYCAFFDISKSVLTWRGQPDLQEELFRELELLEREILINPFFEMAANSGQESKVHLARFICTLILSRGPEHEEHPLHELAQEIVNVWQAPPPHVKTRLGQFLAGPQRVTGFNNEMQQRLIDVMARSLLMERIRQWVNFAAEAALKTSLGQAANDLTSNAGEAQFDASALVGFFQRLLGITFRFSEYGIIVKYDKGTTLISV